MTEDPFVWFSRLFLNVGLLFGPLFYWLKWSERNKDRYLFIDKWFGWICIVLLGAGWLSIQLIWKVIGEDRPGALFENNDYHAWVWVYAYPKDSETVNYKIPALIHSVRESENDVDGPSVTYRQYWLLELELPNRSLLEFSEGQALELNERVTVFYGNNHFWGIEMTDQKVQGKEKVN